MYVCVCVCVCLCFFTGPEEKKVKSKKEKMKERRERWLNSEFVQRSAFKWDWHGSEHSFDIIHFYKITPEYMVPSSLLAVEVGCKSFNSTYLNYILDEQIITIWASVNSPLLMFNRFCLFTFYLWFVANQFIITKSYIHQPAATNAHQSTKRATESSPQQISYIDKKKYIYIQPTIRYFSIVSELWAFWLEAHLWVSLCL